MMMTHLTTKEVEEMDEILDQVNQENFQRQIESNLEISRIFDAISDNGGEIYAVSTEDTFVSIDADESAMLEAALMAKTVFLYVHCPDYVELSGPFIKIENGIVSGFAPNTKWMRKVLFPTY